MATRPYSTKFIRTNIAQVWVNYTVPAGYRAVVKTVSITQTGSTAALNWVQIGGVTVGSFSAPGTLGGVVLNMSHVAYAGEVIRLYLGAVNIEGAVSGYLLLDDGSGPRVENELEEFVGIENGIDGSELLG